MPPSDTSWQARTVPDRIWARTKSPLARSAARSTGGGAPSSRPAISRSHSDWPSQPLVAPISTMSSQGGRARPTAVAASSSTPRPPIAGRGQDAAALGLVVEADVAGHDREVQRLAGGGHAADGGGELAHDLGLLRVAEVHVVGDRQRAGADRGQVAPGFGHRLGAAGLRVGGAVARRAVGGQRQARGRGPPASPRRRRRRRGASPSCRRRCCRTGPRSRRASKDRGRRSAFAARSVRPIRSSTLRRVEHLRLRRLGGGAVIQRRLVVQRGQRDVGLDLAMVPDDDAAGVGQVADDGEVQLPFLENGPRALASRSGRSTISMRSWLSDSMNS